MAAGAIGDAQVTPDGRFLVFNSTADLTPDEGARTEAGQVFEYDVQTGSLVRVSRGQNGHNEDGNSSVYPATILEQDYTIARPTNQFTGLSVSADGAYIYFTSKDGLTSEAESGVVNVYEYHNGYVALISDGHDNVSVLGGPAVELLGTDESGMDVFFRTADQLVPQDTDTQLDVYDARINGGSSQESIGSICSSNSPCSASIGGSLPGSAPATSRSEGENLIPTGPPVLVAHKPVKPKPKFKKKKNRRKHSRKVKIKKTTMAGRP